MIKKRIMVFAGFCILAGCATMPNPVDTAYLREIKSDESTQLKIIERSIVKKKRGKDLSEKKYRITRQEVKLSNSVISFINARKRLLIEKEKLYSLSNDNKRIIEVKQSIKQNILLSSQQKNYHKYAIAAQNDTKALMEIKQTEMSVLIGKLNYEKAKIAKTYQAKRPEEFGQKKSGIAKFFKNKRAININEYKNYLNKQESILKDKMKRRSETAKILKRNEQFKDLNTADR